MYILLRQDPPETDEVTKRNQFVAHRLLMFVSQMKERGCTRTSEYFWSAVYAVGYAFRGNCRVPERYFQVVAFQNTLFISDSFQNFIDITLGKILSRFYQCTVRNVISRKFIVLRKFFILSSSRQFYAISSTIFD